MFTDFQRGERGGGGGRRSVSKDQTPNLSMCLDWKWNKPNTPTNLAPPARAQSLSKLKKIHRKNMLFSVVVMYSLLPQLTKSSLCIETPPYLVCPQLISVNCHLNKINFLFNSVHYSSIRIHLQRLQSLACKTATGHYSDFL